MIHAVGEEVLEVPAVMQACQDTVPIGVVIHTISIQGLVYFGQGPKSISWLSLGSAYSDLVWEVCVGAQIGNCSLCQLGNNELVTSRCLWNDRDILQCTKWENMWDISQGKYHHINVVFVEIPVERLTHFFIFLLTFGCVSFFARCV